MAFSIGLKEMCIRDSLDVVLACQILDIERTGDVQLTGNLAADALDAEMCIRDRRMVAAHHTMAGDEYGEGICPIGSRHRTYGFRIAQLS